MNITMTAKNTESKQHLKLKLKYPYDAQLQFRK